MVRIDGDHRLVARIDPPFLRAGVGPRLAPASGAGPGLQPAPGTQWRLGELMFSGDRATARVPRVNSCKPLLGLFLLLEFLLLARMHRSGSVVRYALPQAPDGAQVHR